MIKEDNLYNESEVRTKLLQGISKVASAVGATMGTAGSNFIIECVERPGYFVTNDGFTIANQMRLADPIEELGRKILLEAINRANKQSGDGSSTTCVLTSAILEEGMKHIGEASPMEIKRSLEACIPLIEKSIKSQKKDITVDTVKQVASISAEDEKIGEMIQEIYQKIGKDGIIQWDISKTAEDFYTIGTGLTINGATYVSPYMCDVDEKTGAFLNVIRWKDPAILLCKQKISSSSDFNDLFSHLNNQDKKEVVLFCNEIEFPVVADFIKTRIERGFRVAVVKMPVLWKDEWWEDLAIASGATIIDPVVGITLFKLKEEYLGTFKHITIGKEDTIIDGTKDLTLHIASLQSEGTDASLLRASRLNTRTARYFVGAQSESSLAYRRLKVEDSLNAAACALENGVVAGGGVALLTAGYELPKLDNIGALILKHALREPFNQIVKNAGNPEIPRTLQGGYGFNSKTGEIVDMYEAGIVDPTDVVLNAVRNAIGVAASILTTKGAELYPREEKQQL